MHGALSCSASFFQKKKTYLSVYALFLKYPWQYKRRIFSQNLCKVRKTVLSQFLEDKALLCDYLNSRIMENILNFFTALRGFLDLRYPRGHPFRHHF